MLLGIVDGQLYMEETRPNERAAFIEINHTMSINRLYKRDKFGNLVYEDFYRVIQADAFHRFCGEPLPNWFNKEKEKLIRFLKNRDKQVDDNPHYVYEKFHWESENDFKDIEDDACEYTSD